MSTVYEAGAPEFLGMLKTLSESDTLLVALDFDGVLAPEVDDPLDARTLPASQEHVLHLLELAETPVAFVSGRAMDSLVEVAKPPPGLLLAGSHGVEERIESGGVRTTLSEPELADRHSIEHALDRISQPLEGVWVEGKPAGFALHTRLASRADAEQAHETAEQEIARLVPGVKMRHGKNVLEFSVRQTNKGDAVDNLRRHTGATGVLYAGDDVTDEDAFAVLGESDLGIKVGPGGTRADLRVSDPWAFSDVLRQLAELRARAVRTPPRV